MKTMGEKIREYRKKAGMTQEQMAGRLGVTYQTVSKWETGTSSPDLSLIVPLTRLLGISTDELFGVNDREPDKRYRELEEAYDRTYKTEDFAGRQEICETAVAEYPGDMKWLSNLAWVVSNRSFEYEDHEKCVAERERAIKLFDAVIKNCKDELLRGDAIEGITQLLGWRGRRDEAKRYAEMLPERVGVSRDSVMENCLDGEELILCRQKKIMSRFFDILWELSLLQYEENGDILCEKIEELVSVAIPDGNYLIFNNRLYYAAQRRVDIMTIKGADADIECVLSLLGDMKKYAADYDRILFDKPGVYKYTSPMFDRIDTDTRDWLGSEGETMMQGFEEYLSDPKFDFLRDDPNFKAIMEA